VFVRAGRRKCAGALLLMILVSMAGCGSPSEVRLGAGNDGEQVEIKEGQFLVITLESNPTTGYQWEVIEVDALVLKQQGEATFEMADSGEPPPPGTGGTETFRFEVVGAGQTSLELIYHRPWEKDVEPLATFSIRVVVP
jgi:inhibitor of cysteine peptidase